MISRDLNRKTRTIDINKATAEEIGEVARLKGLGFEIVRYREDRGRFETKRQLEEVPGLSGKVEDFGTEVRFG